jgi:hypothetical protein
VVIFSRACRAFSLASSKDRVAQVAMADLALQAEPYLIRMMLISQLFQFTHGYLRVFNEESLFTLKDDHDALRGFHSPSMMIEIGLSRSPSFGKDRPLLGRTWHWRQRTLAGARPIDVESLATNVMPAPRLEVMLTKR